MKAQINHLIATIYQNALSSNLLSFRQFISSSIGRLIVYDTISWDIQDINSNNIVNNWSSNISIDKSKLHSLGMGVATKQIETSNNINALDVLNNSHMLTGTTVDFEKNQLHKVKFIRNKEQQKFSIEDFKLFELIVPHLIEGLSINMMHDSNRQRENKIESLTQKERTVIELVAKGLTNKLIANKLKISPSTINNHLTNIYSKIGVNSRVGAIKELVI